MRLTTDGALIDTFKIEASGQSLWTAIVEGRGWTVDRSGACEDYDAIYEKDEVSKFAEEKFRYTNRQPKDVLIEIVQDLFGTYRRDGWAIKTKATWVPFVWHNEATVIAWLILDWSKFKPWYKQVLGDTNFGEYLATNRGFGTTVNLVLPLANIDKSVVVGCSDNLLRLVSVMGDTFSPPAYPAGTDVDWAVNDTTRRWRQIDDSPMQMRLWGER